MIHSSKYISFDAVPVNDDGIKLEEEAGLNSQILENLSKIKMEGKNEI